MLAKINTLPGTKVQPPIGHWKHQTAAQKAGFEMCGQIIGPFIGVFVRRIPAGIGHEVPEIPFKITTNRWVCIFIQRQTSRGMLDQNMEQSDGN